MRKKLKCMQTLLYTYDVEQMFLVAHMLQWFSHSIHNSTSSYRRISNVIIHVNN